MVIKHVLAPELCIRGESPSKLIYVNNVPDVHLTRLYNRIVSEHDEKVAVYSVRLLSAAISHIDRPWFAPNESWVAGINALLRQHYGADVQQRGAHTYVYCKGASHSTLKTVIARLKTCCNSVIALGWRDETPFGKTGLKRPSGRHNQYLGKPAGQYKIHAYKVIPQELLDNRDLPAQLRDAASRAGWSVRDRAILEMLISTGARVSEIVEMCWGSYDAERSVLQLRSKGSHGHLSKSATLSRDANRLLTEYIASERMTFDPMYSRYMATRGARPWSYTSYTQYVSDPLATPMFISSRGTPYTVPTFRRGAWRQLGNNIEIRPHQIRYWYVNQALDRILEVSQSDWEIIKSARAFATRMGWASWHPLQTYDLRGVVTQLLEEHARQLGRASDLEPAAHLETLLENTIRAGVIPAYAATL
ncbi:site-specific integrase [Deinococcus fonticola]|uniref:site-specific integrase n=1 Tax=Deinococcus fonticola TaxID=2528713 RepID=UPI001430A81B|nr:site-specific integrase [Deinococcus fonticola]